MYMENQTEIQTGGLLEDSQIEIHAESDKRDGLMDGQTDSHNDRQTYIRTFHLIKIQCPLIIIT